MKSDPTHAGGMRAAKPSWSALCPSVLQVEGRGLSHAVGVGFPHQFFLWLLVMTTKIRGCFKLLREKKMAVHSSTIAWKISWTEEPGRLQSMGSQRVGHDWAISVQFSHWRNVAWHQLEKLSFKEVKESGQCHANHGIKNVGLTPIPPPTLQICRR